jgi:hypothetical protein
MKNKSLQIFFLLIFSYQFIFSQEKPKAELIDELSLPTNCCDLGNRLMNIREYERFKNNEDSNLYLVINGKSNILRALMFERFYVGMTKSSFYNLNEERVKFIRTSKSNELKIEFWIAPKDADISFLNRNPLDLSELEIEKPQVFYNSFDVGGDCHEFGVNKHFSEILLANQELRGHIVIFDSSAKQFNQTEKQLLNEISEKLNVTRNQLRTFFIKQPKNNMPYYELWLVPKKSRN